MSSRDQLLNVIGRLTVADRNSVRLSALAESDAEIIQFRGITQAISEAVDLLSDIVAEARTAAVEIPSEQQFERRPPCHSLNT